MRVGSLYEKAGPRLTGFVFGCTCILIVLLYSMVEAETKGASLVSIAPINNSSGF
jgi:hypothetical protein